MNSRPSHVMSGISRTGNAKVSEAPKKFMILDQDLKRLCEGSDPPPNISQERY